MRRRSLLAALMARAAAAQERKPEPPGPGFICPMDRDVKNSSPGKCPRCGMKLVANLPDPEEYLLDLTSTPRALVPGRPGLLRFSVRHPKTGKLVREFETVHERLFHTFLISSGLSDFAHEHPSLNADGSFTLPVLLRKSGAYRVVADFFPKDGTPQFLAKTIFTAGSQPPGPPPVLTADLAPKQAANLRVELVTEPKEPIAGQETLLFFSVSPNTSLEPYLGAWGHLLMASDDLVDVVHDHPLYVDGVPPPDLKVPAPSRIQFNAIFPRERMYRVWVQFARGGVVNTAAFTLPVKTLR